MRCRGRGRGLGGRSFRRLLAAPCSFFLLAIGLAAGGEVAGPVGLLAGVVTVGGVPAAVEDRLLRAIGAPLLLLRVRDRLLLLHLKIRG